MANPPDYIAAIRFTARSCGLGPESAVMSDSTSSTSFQLNPKAKPFIPGALVHPPVPVEIFTNDSTNASTFVFNPKAPPFYPRSGTFYPSFGMHEQFGWPWYTVPPVYNEDSAPHHAAYEESVSVSSFNTHNIASPGMEYALPSRNSSIQERIWALNAELIQMSVQHWFQQQWGHFDHPECVQQPGYSQYPSYDALSDYYREYPQQFNGGIPRATLTSNSLTPKDQGQKGKTKNRRAKKASRVFAAPHAELGYGDTQTNT